METALREVKEYALRKPGDIDRDVLFAKLLHLEEKVRRVNHKLAKTLSFIIARFHVHKGEDYAPRLVLGLLSSKEEAAILTQEQKFLKLQKTLAKDEKDQGDRPGSGDVSSHPPLQAPQAQYPPPPPWYTGPTAYYPPWYGGGRARGRRFQPRGGRGRGAQFPAPGGCFICGAPDHFVRECPKNPNNPTSGPASQ